MSIIPADALAGYIDFDLGPNEQLVISSLGNGPTLTEAIIDRKSTRLNSSHRL